MGLLRLFLVSILSLMTIPAQAADGAFAYKGLPLGSDIKAFKKSNPDFFCSENKSRHLLCMSETATYFGIRAEQIVTGFVDGKMGHVEVLIKFPKPVADNKDIRAKSTYIELKKSLIARYGAPKESSDGFGQFYEKGWSAMWQKKDSLLVMFLAPNGDSRGNAITMELHMDLKSYATNSLEIYKKEQQKDL